MSQQLDPRDEMKRISRRSFIWAGVTVLGVAYSVNWIATRPNDKGIPWPLRRAMQTTDQLMEELFSQYRLEPELSADRITKEPRANGHYGEIEEMPTDYMLTLAGLSDMEAKFTTAELMAMPSKSMTTEFRCVEGWSQVVQWKGVPLREVFAMLFKATDAAKPPPYVYLETIDADYFIGLDTESALHPQSLLAYEINGAPLTLDHGAPIRLVIPTKYGIKNIKWVTKIEFRDSKPDDYWGDRGYTWFGGL
jgi:DMSO/TMAO reductase YedYZ molybdopterin-dependent catalytic subunit